MKAINPFTEEPAGEYPDHTPAQVERILRQSEGAFAEWRRTSFEHRAALMTGAAQILRRRRGEFAGVMTREMGKPITAAEAEVDKCASNCDFYAQNARRFLAIQPVETDATRSYVRYDPLGAVLAIMPWNFPFWQVFRFAAPALMAGNVAVLKHASNVPGCALAIEEVFRAAGFPDGCFKTLLVESRDTDTLISHPAVRAVTLTGSEKAGMAVAAAAGKALKKSVLELGGSDPFVVIPPPQGREHLEFLHDVAPQAAQARCINSGQSCIAAKRFIVVGATDAFEQAMAAAMQRLNVGDPMDRATQIGPLAREDLLEAVHDQVQRTLAAGAHLVTGGRRIDRRGYFYAPTILSDVTPGMPAWDEEVFGPVAAVTSARDVDHAVELANQSPYGLGASIWTPDVALAERLAGRIDAGCVFVNGQVKSDPRLPFGGVKQSGFGRELADVGIREFVNIKSVWVKGVGQFGETPESE